MEREHWQRMRKLLEHAIELANPERDKFLSTACGADDQMRAELESILIASASAPQFLETPAVDALAANTDEDIQAHIGQMAGSFRLEQFIASGGMGSVFLGIDTAGEQPVEGAVKLLKRRVVTTELLRRFQIERQSLHTLQHPNIASLIDAGVLEGGRPYLVMEYVNGIPIDRYCDEHRLTIHERLRLFCTVCSAVSHAHQRLIVHRDLKPSNILVTSDGRSKLLDFGISKAIDTLDSTDTTADTQTQQRVMTPEYASPEQIRGAHAATSADVYSLGVILYELLTGHRPYRFRSRTPHEMERTICDEQPENPSKAIFRSTDANLQSFTPSDVPTPEVVGRARKELPSRLRSQLTGDLDAIVMKSLRKEPEHRYSSVEAFSDDLDRHLRGSPVLAHKGTAWYRLSKFASRNKAAVVCSGLAVIALIAGLAAAVWQGQLASEAQRVAEAEARNARSVSLFLQETLAGVDPLAAGSDDATVHQILDDAANKLALGALRDQPESKAAVHLIIGMTFLELGAFEPAEAHIQQALAVRVKTLGERTPGVAECLSGLGMLAKARGEYEDAESFYRQSLEIREEIRGLEHVETAESLNNLGVLFKVQGRYLEARELLRNALTIRQKELPERHKDVATTSSNLAAVLKHLGDFDAAESLYRTALETYREVLGPEHLRVAGCMNNLALLLRERGDIAAAEALLRNALAIRRKVFGGDHPAVGTGLHNLALMLQLGGDTDEAELLYREALELRRNALGSDHPSVANTANNLADLLIAMEQLDDAEALAHKALEIRRAKLPPRHPRIAGSLLVLGKVLLRKNHAEASQPLLREALTMSQATFPPGHRQVVTAQTELGACLTALGRFDEAEFVLLEAQAAISNQANDSIASALTPIVLSRLESLYTAWNRPLEAEKYGTELRKFTSDENG